MTEPASQLPPTEPGRWAARCSILAAFVCFTLMCTFQQLTAKKELVGFVAWAYYGISTVASLFVLGGVALGFYGFVLGLRRRSLDTSGIAVIGLVLNLGLVFLVVWGRWLISQAR